MENDEFLPTRPEIFCRLVRDYKSSFTISLKQRRDRGFHVYREFSQFHFKLRLKQTHQCILTFCMPDVKALGISRFLTSSKLDTRLDLACMTKADTEEDERKNDGLTLDEITKECKEEFPRTARSFVIFLFEGTQGLGRFTSDNVKVLALFDLDILLVDPLENAICCFEHLFSRFRLRDVVQAEDELIHAEKHVSFFDILRQLQPWIQQPNF